MALRQQIEWDPEEVAAGYDLSSIYEEVVDNSTAPVISSVANTTALVDPATNITVGLSHLLKEVVEKGAEIVVNTTTTTTASTTVEPSSIQHLSSSTPSTVSTIMKRVVEHLGREPSIPVATVCIIYAF